MAKDIGKFEDWPFKVPHIKSVIKKENALTAEFSAAKSQEEAYKIVKKAERYSDKISDEITHVQVLYSLDTTNAKYEKAMNTLNEGLPLVSAAQLAYTKALVSSPYRPYLEQKLGSFIFTMYEYQLKSFDEKIIPEATEENKLSMQYMAATPRSRFLSAGAPITFRRWANSSTTPIGRPAKRPARRWMSIS
jgi:oligoendopeptidase F